MVLVILSLLWWATQWRDSFLFIAEYSVFNYVVTYLDWSSLANCDEYRVSNEIELNYIAPK